MACFIVPAVEAVVTTVITKAVASKENVQESGKISFSHKLKWLNHLLWGGSGLLAFEHVWHGEITPVFPFLTNAANPAELFHELTVSGVGMSALVTLVWIGMVMISSKIENTPSIPALPEGAES